MELKKFNFTYLLFIITALLLTSYYLVIYWYTMNFDTPFFVDKYNLFTPIPATTHIFYILVLFPLEPISILILFLGFIKLQKFRRIKLGKWTAFSMILFWEFFMLISLYMQYLLMTYTIYYSLWLVILLILIKTLGIPLSFIILGISNRTSYGNFLVSSGMIRFLEIIGFSIFMSSFFLLAGILSGEYDFVIICTLIMVSSITTIALYSSFLFYFGIKKGNKYILAYAILIFIIEVGKMYVDYAFLGGFFIRMFYLTIMYLAFLLIGIVVAIKFFELGKRFKRGVKVFISHAVVDSEAYRIKEIAKFMESQKNISQVHYCERDLHGNIDKWMNKTVPNCQTLVFIATKNSIPSEDCETELNLAKTKKLQIIPILGDGIKWEDLKGLDIHREYGVESPHGDKLEPQMFHSFEPYKFKEFCNTIYERIMKHKEAVESELPKMIRKR